MSTELWGPTDAYLARTLLSGDPDFTGFLSANAAAGLPAQDVSALQGKFLALLVRMIGARRVLEIGTLGGYSTAWMASALPPGGRIISLESDPHHAAIARANLSQAGFRRLVDVRIGPAAQTLADLRTEADGSFDLFFIDADKQSTRLYVELCLALSRPGSVIVCDNIVRDGGVLDENSSDARVQGVREGLAYIADHPKLSATGLQTVGLKGWDGFALAIVL
jgi:predicted O-methyltransferase YrrM